MFLRSEKNDVKKRKDAISGKNRQKLLGKNVYITVLHKQTKKETMNHASIIITQRIRLIILYDSQEGEHVAQGARQGKITTTFCIF